MSRGYFPKIETVSKNNKKGPFSEFYLISRQKGQTSRVNIHQFIVTKFHAFQPQGACEARVQQSSMAGTAKTGD